MPMYEYQCGVCDHVFEELVRATDKKPAVACPACGRCKVVRRPSVFAARSTQGRPQPTLPEGCEGQCGPNPPCGL